MSNETQKFSKNTHKILLSDSIFRNDSLRLLIMALHYTFIVLFIVGNRLFLRLGAPDVGLANGHLEVLDRAVLAATLRRLLNLVKRVDLSGETVLRWGPQTIRSVKSGSVVGLLNVVRVLREVDGGCEESEGGIVVERTTTKSGGLRFPADGVQGGFMPPDPTLTTPSVESRTHPD